MADAIQRSRAGHISLVTCQENNTKQILEKDPSLVSSSDLSKLRFSLRRCVDQQEKINTLNQEILQALETAKVSEDAMQREHDKINTNDFKVGSLIHMLGDFIEKVKGATEDGHADDQSSTHSITRSRNVSLKLPKTALPTFWGKYSEWTPFFDLFQNTVDCNRSLNDIQKLQYLKTSLKDQPARLLSHLPTSVNYEVALKFLKERYDNKRMMIRSHLDAIVKFSPMQQESADQLRKLVTVFVENSLALTALGEVDSADYIWVYLLAEKLDSETRRHWELHSPRDKWQTTGDLLKLLEERARGLDFATPKNTDKAKTRDTGKFKDKRDVQLYHSQAATSCPKCSEHHGIFSCSDFHSLSVEESSIREKQQALLQLFENRAE